MLKMWSSVLAHALDAAHNDRAKNSTCSGSDGQSPSEGVCNPKIQIPMLDTSKDDRLLVTSFLYPVVPEPDMTWEWVEGLLTLADKFCMPALMHHISNFMLKNSNQLTAKSDSYLFAWKWINLCEKFGLYDVLKGCIRCLFSYGRSLRELALACPIDQVSCSTLEVLINSMAMKLY